MFRNLLILLCLPMLLPAFGAVAQTSSTVVYDQEFFSQFPNAVSAADLIRRIPGGRRILDSGSGNARGFSRNDDRILINGKRMAGKGNDSRSALDRITVAQVERIELIRGSSPDIKVSSTEAILNIITRGTLSKGSGSWQAETRVTRDGRVQPGGFLSYGGTLGKLDYFASLKFEPENNITDRIEEVFDGAGQLTKRIIEKRKETRNDGTASLNLSYNFENGNQLKLNGQFSEDGETFDQPGRFFVPDALGVLTEAGQAFRLEKMSRPRWEIGGDFEASLSDRFRLKILGLYSRTDESFRQGEDFEITGGTIENDVLSIEDKLSTEAIGRASLIWSLKPGSELEFGSEFSLNKLTSGLDVFERLGGILVEQNVSASDTIVKETRNESFLIYTTKLSAKLSLEASLFTEYSKIEQTGDARNSRTFFFARPAVDLRYNLDERNQLQLSFKRNIGQLDFEDFASTVNEDDELVAGNINLVPWKEWTAEVGYEHRLANDGGSVKLVLIYADIQDVTESIEISPGVSGIGNVGDASQIGFRLEGNLRLDWLGLKSAVLENSLEYKRLRLTDAFTGQRRRADWSDRLKLRTTLRQDIGKWGLSWSLNYRRQNKSFFHDFDERIAKAGPRHWVWVTFDKKLPMGAVFRVTFARLIDNNIGRDRLLFAAGRAGGIVTSRELRREHNGRRLDLSLKGTF